MTPEEKVARMAGLTARLVSLVCAADMVLPTDQQGGMGLLNEALILSRDIKALRAPDGLDGDGAWPNLAIADGGKVEGKPAAALLDVLKSLDARLVILETRMGSNGGPPLIDPPTSPPPTSQLA